MLDKEGKESLVFAVCCEASEKSARAFWAFRQLGYLQVVCHHIVSLVLLYGLPESW